MNPLILVVIVLALYKFLSSRKGANKIVVEKSGVAELPSVTIWGRDRKGSKAVAVEVTATDKVKTGEQISKYGGTTAIAYRLEGNSPVIVVTNDGTAVEELTYPDFATMYANAKSK